MNNIKKSLLPIILLTIAFLAGSCTTWSTRDWNDLKDRNFYFQRFKYSEKGINKKNALELMEKFPVKKMLKILSHKYNITIDSSEFEDFISSGSSSGIHASGLFVDSVFVWESKNTHANTIEFEYQNSLNVNSSEESKKYKLFLKVNGTDRALCAGALPDTFPMLVTIAGDMGYKRQNGNSDDYYVNSENKSIVSLLPSESDIKLEKIKIESKISKDKIKEQIKEYTSNMSQEEKKKFRDDIIKFLYTVIE